MNTKNYQRSAALALGLVVLAGCSGQATPPASTTSSQTQTPTPTVTAERRYTADELGHLSGLPYEPSEPPLELFVQTSGTLYLNDDIPVYVKTFANTDAQKNWGDIASQFGGYQHLDVIGGTPIALACDDQATLDAVLGMIREGVNRG